jgi:hypothetical protein
MEEDVGGMKFCGLLSPRLCGSRELFVVAYWCLGHVHVVVRPSQQSTMHRRTCASSSKPSTTIVHTASGLSRLEFGCGGKGIKSRPGCVGFWGFGQEERGREVRSVGWLGLFLCMAEIRLDVVIHGKSGAFFTGGVPKIWYTTDK